MGGEDIREEVVKEEDIIKETWGTMSLGKRLEYLWMYYKSWLFAAVVLIGLICLGVTMYKGMHTKVLLNAVVIGGDSQKSKWLKESFARYAGIEEKDGEVRIRANIPDDKGGATSKTALTTLMGADAVDVLVCSESVFEEYANQDGFLDLEEFLGEKAADYGDAGGDYGVLLKPGNILEQEAMTSYDRIYVAIPVNSQNPEMAARFIEYLCSNAVRPEKGRTAEEILEERLRGSYEDTRENAKRKFRLETNWKYLTNTGKTSKILCAT